VKALADALAASERPLLWIGGGARDAGDAVDALARRLGAPVVTTYRARGVLAPDHPLLVPAPPHEPEVTALIERADLAIVVGSDLDQMNTMQWRLPLPDRRIAVNLDAADANKNYAMDEVIETDARALSADVPAREPWAGDLHELGTVIRGRLSTDDRTRDAIVFLEHTEAALPSDIVVFADMCVAGYWIAGHLRVETNRGLHYPMGWGTLGFALPAAIGASVAAPTVAFVGDGGMLFALGELSALAQLRTACTIVVVDDNGYGMLRYGVHATAGNDLPPVDFVHAAQAFGIAATSVDGVGPDYAKALAQAVERAEPSLLHVRARLEPPVTTTPFWPIRG
jgi:thiamine pyrophosphate-dependent acetolactate synthase large subunit-like protein